MNLTANRPVDVNQAFLDTRLNQIALARQAREQALASQSARTADFDKRVAEGKLRPLGDGRFRVNEPGSWDDGEVLYLRPTRFGALILPETNLDTTAGRTALYSAVPTWHGTGTVIPGGTTDIDEVLRLGGIDFKVGLRPAMFQAQEDGPYMEVADKFVTVREDTGAALGIVGKVYTPFQNRDAFSFLQDLVLKYDITWESAGATYGGTRVFISFRLPREVRVDAGGVNDLIEPFIVFLNSHDGTTRVVTCMTPWRPVCSNTERFALRDAKARWGHVHSRNVANKVQEARRELELSMDYFDKFANEQEKLAQTPMDIDAFIAAISDVFEPPAAAEADSKHADYRSKLANLVGRFENNANTLGRTAYAAERAVTEFLDHRQLKPRGILKGNFAAAHATRILDGEDDPVKTKAHRRLMTLVRR